MRSPISRRSAAYLDQATNPDQSVAFALPCAGCIALFPRSEAAFALALAIMPLALAPTGCIRESNNGGKEPEQPQNRLARGQRRSAWCRRPTRLGAASSPSSSSASIHACPASCRLTSRQRVRRCSTKRSRSTSRSRATPSNAPSGWPSCSRPASATSPAASARPASRRPCV